MNEWNVTLRMPPAVLGDFRWLTFNGYHVAGITHLDHPYTIFIGTIYGLNPARHIMPLLSHETLHAVLDAIDEHAASKALDRLRLRGTKDGMLSPGTSSLGIDGLWDPELISVPMASFVLRTVWQRDTRLHGAWCFTKSAVLPKPSTILVPFEPSTAAKNFDPARKAVVP